MSANPARSAARGRDLLARAAARPWRWCPADSREGWAAPDQLIHYRLLDSSSVRYVMQHAQTWPIRDAEADLIVTAVNEYEALLDVEEQVRKAVVAWRQGQSVDADFLSIEKHLGRLEAQRG